MRHSRLGLAMAAVSTLFLMALFAMSALAAPLGAGDPARGKYIFEAAGGCGCHGPDLAGFRPDAPGQGGAAFQGPFGTVTAKNITPDGDTGIGGWTDAQIQGAIQNGVDNQGLPLFPIMPYMSYHSMSTADAADLVAFLRTVPAVSNNVPDNTLNVPVPTPPQLPPSPATAPTSGTDRGRYLATAVGLCSDCHTPDMPSGAPDLGKFLAGANNPGIGAAPNLTPDKVTGLGNWSDTEILGVLRNGVTPEGTDVKGLMSEVIYGSPIAGGGYNKLTDSDLRSIVAFLRGLPAVSHVAKTGAGFQLGFKTLSDMIPNKVGLPLDNERGLSNGDTVQDSTGGFLLWRKSDGAATFTDGATTWLLGPNGLETRPNGAKLPWEKW
ncbi:MAG TPA: c-type cytochrome [Chloroflexota bacterium]